VEDADYSEADLRAELATQGVNVETYLARLGQEAGIKPSAGTAKKPTASERLRALADRTGYKVKGLLSGLGADDVGDLPATAYGRSGRRNKRPHASPRGKRGRKSNG
jgi:hypothetical protein